MTAPSENWSNIATTQVDADSPLDAVLMAAIRADLIHLKEWLGKDYTAAQNHNHDGVNSAAIDIGIDIVRNGSFETGDLSGWDDTVATGGTIQVQTSGAMDGNYCVAITSTVLGNGGGYIDNAGFLACTGGEKRQFQLVFKASVSGVSSKAEAIWYDATQSQISISTIYTTTSTPTTKRMCVRRIEAPATARYCKIRLTGGIAATGTATGTIYFDGVSVGLPALVGGMQVFTASGTFSAVWGDVEADVIGAAGGDNSSSGNTGGQGGRAYGQTTTSADISVTVGTYNGPYTTGGNSTFLTLTGGGGGGASTVSNGGGGAASGGAINRTGAGGYAFYDVEYGYGGGIDRDGVVVVRW